MKALNSLPLDLSDHVNAELYMDIIKTSFRSFT